MNSRFLKIIFQLIALLILSKSLKAEVPDYLLNGSTNKANNTLQSSLNFKPTFKRNYNVKSYSLDFNWYDMLKSAKKEWSGVSIIKLVPETDTITQIVMDAGDLIIKEIKFENKSIDFLYNKDQSSLIILPNRTINKDEELEFHISFADTSFDNLGINFYEKDNIGTNRGIYDNIAYTMSEPKEARFWMPCNDNPFDRAISDVRVKVPTGFIAVANGKLIDSTTIGDTTYFQWRHDFEIPTYLMSVTASTFLIDRDSTTLKSGKKIEMPYFYWKELIPTDSAYIPITRLHGNMMNFFSDVFFEYPYEKYSVVFVPAFLGGMEHNTITRVDTKWRSNSYASGFAHELAHHWLGNYITCADWQDLWINEGGATWAAAIWLEHYFGNEAYVNEIRSNANGYIYGDDKNHPIYDLPENILFHWSLTYAKAGMFYQMMSELVGREQFYKTLQKIFTTYPTKSITTEQFLEVVKNENPESIVDWDIFFEQWLFKRGYPIYDINIEYSKLNETSDSTIAHINIKQTQAGENIPEVFEMPISIQYAVRENDKLNIKVQKSYFMSEREQSFIDTLAFLPAEQNTNEIILLHKSTFNKSIVEENIQEEQISIFPNITSIGSMININIISPILTEKVNIDLYNQMGEHIENYNILDNLGTYKIRVPYNVSAGVYYLKLQFNNRNIMQKIIIQ